MSIEQILAAALQGDDDNKGSRYAATTPERIEYLKEQYALFTQKHTFKPGDIVRWKSGLKNRKGSYEEAYIVIEVLDEPMFDSKHGSGNAYFHEPLDLQLAELNDDGDFIAYWYDSRRFEPFSQS